MSQSLTKGLIESDLSQLATMCRFQRISKDTTFIYEDSPPDFVYLITSGGVRVYVNTADGKEVTLALLGSKEIVGEMAYLDNANRSASVQAINDTEVLVLNGDDFRKIYYTNPTVASNLHSILSKRIRDTNQALEEIMASSLTERTAKVLSILEKHFPDGEISLSHDELALILGATRPRVTEVLHSLREAGKIKLSRNKIRFSREQT